MNPSERELRADVDRLFERVRRAGHAVLSAAGHAWVARWGPYSAELRDAVERSRLVALEHGLYLLRQAVFGESTVLVRAVLGVYTRTTPYAPVRAVRDAATAVAVGGPALLHPDDVERLTGPLLSVLPPDRTCHDRRCSSDPDTDPRDGDLSA